MPNSHPGERILVVEDDPEVRGLLLQQLQSLGYAVEAAADAEAALGILQGSLAIDLLLSDIKLSGAMNGVQLATVATQIRPRLAVLFISGYPDAALARGTAAGAADMLWKPFRKAELAAGVRAALDRRASRLSRLSPV